MSRPGWAASAFVDRGVDAAPAPSCSGDADQRCLPWTTRIGRAKSAASCARAGSERQVADVDAADDHARRDRRHARRAGRGGAGERDEGDEDDCAVNHRPRMVFPKFRNSTFAVRLPFVP